MESSPSQHLDDLKNQGWKCPGKNIDGVDLPNVFNDKDTLLYYPNLKEMRDSRYSVPLPSHYIFSIYHQLVFFEAVGLGALKTTNGNGRGIITLSEAARFCLSVSKKKRSEVQSLKVKKQTQDEYQDHVKHWNIRYRK
jgi:hypothetical protein